jgi:hypothetical protein
MFAQWPPLISDILDAALIACEIARTATAAETGGMRRAVGHSSGIIDVAHVGIERSRTIGGQGLRPCQLRRVGRFADPCRNLVGSSGFRSSSSSTNAATSILEYCSSLIACRSCGVMTRLCV